MAFDPLAHPIIYTLPERMASVSAWIGHIPLAYLMVDLLRPRTFVELGTHTGVSYAAFCQAVQLLKLETRCTAVDTWAGDAHIGKLGPEVLAEFKSFHDPRYSGFSNLVQADFNAAADVFEERSIDLLHIDGCHTYEAVRHDFETYFPKLSERGVVLFHDSADRSAGLGVYRLVEELARQYPHFEFFHACGLAIVLTGGEAPTEMIDFINAANVTPEAYRTFFQRLGNFLQAVMISNEITILQVQQVEAANAVMARCGLPVDPNSTNLDLALKSPVQYAMFASKHLASVFNLIQVK